jgi:hypothetical protein
MDTRNSEFIQFARHPVWFRLYMARKLPSAFFSGLRVRQLDEKSAIVSVPYNWFTKNPFRSTYFACLGMAAEMSTGILAMAYVYKHNPPISLLVTQVESRFLKKAGGKTFFTCNQGLEIGDAVQKSVATGESQTIRVASTGTNGKGEAVAEFYITWSFKVKSPKG